MQKSNIDIYHGLPVEDALGRRQPEDSRKLQQIATTETSPQIAATTEIFAEDSLGRRQPEARENIKEIQTTESTSQIKNRPEIVAFNTEQRTKIGNTIIFLIIK